ncbi:uncharacterized protein LOC110366847 [Fundulus heteroclitus]|uniref:uncharacterized protein LOC110366847 n=1 Tax=Fundulus heteroclitus TaxID=8078 RepID=UPI00165B3066|nr:uncharacterized protein LOC110366847 [Fundulus heteroclitus]
MEQTLSWVDMVDLNIQVDYDAIIFPIEDGSDGTRELHLTQLEDGTEIQGESGSSAESETPPSEDGQQDSSSSGGSGSLNSEVIQQACQPSPRSEKPKKDLSAFTSSQAPHSYHQSKHFQGRCQQAERAHNSQDHKRKPRHSQATGSSEARHPQYYKRGKMPQHASAVTVIPPSLDIEQAIKRISDLTQQVDNLKQELQGKVFDLHQEREQRIKFQVDCKAQLEQIQELQKSLEHEHHMRFKCEEKAEKQETFAALQTAGASRFPRIAKVTVHESVLNELQFFRRQVEKNALNSEKLAKALVAEQQLRVKCEDQLRSFKEQQETINSLKSQVGQLTVELNLALKNEHPEVSSQTEASTQTDVSHHTEAATQTKASMKTEVSKQTEAPRQTGPQRKRAVHDVRRPQHEYRRQNTNRGFNANPGLYPHAGHHPNSGLYVNPGLYAKPGLYTHAAPHKNGESLANRRRPPYRGQ